MNTNQEYVIDTKGLSKTYKGVNALLPLDLQVRKNTIFGFLGPNGSHLPAVPVPCAALADLVRRVEEALAGTNLLGPGPHLLLPGAAGTALGANDPQRDEELWRILRHDVPANAAHQLSHGCGTEPISSAAMVSWHRSWCEWATTAFGTFCMEV
jgi:hypothetical protein